MSILTQLLGGGGGGGAPLITSNPARSGYQVGDVVFATQRNFLIPNWLPMRTGSGDDTRYLQSAYPELMAVLPPEAKIAITNPTFGSSGTHLGRLIFGASLFVGTHYSTGSVMTSSDGTTWTERNFGPTPPAFLEFANGRFHVSFGPNSDNAIMTSTNGTGWTWTSTSTSRTWGRPVFGNGAWVVAPYCNYQSGNESNLFTRSTNGTTWTEGTFPQSRNWRDLHYANGLFIAVPATNNSSHFGQYATSPDGLTWTMRTLPNSWTPAVNNDRLITSIGSNFYMYCSGYIIATSTDGINWSRSTNITTLPMAPVNGLYIQGGYQLLQFSKTGEFYSDVRLSPNGSSPTFGSESIAYGNSTYVASYWNGGIAKFGVDEATSFAVGVLTVGNPFNMPYIRAKP
jgi:hypothetical protein